MEREQTFGGSENANEHKLDHIRPLKQLAYPGSSIIQHGRHESVAESQGRRGVRLGDGVYFLSPKVYPLQILNTGPGPGLRILDPMTN